jgi:hypothetical protein
MKISVEGKLGYRRLKHNRPWFDYECSKLIEHWKQATVIAESKPNLWSLKLIIKTKILEIRTEA